MRLFTMLGTVLHVDVASGELRHGTIQTSPRNVVFIPAPTPAEAPRRGSIAHQSGKSCEPIVCLTEHSWSVGSGRLGATTGMPTVFQIVQLERGLVGLRSGGLFLCAEPDGRVTLSRQVCSVWECFSLLEERSASSLELYSGPDQDSVSTVIDWVKITSFMDNKAEEIQYNATIRALMSLWQQTSMQRRLDIRIEDYWVHKQVNSSNPLVKKGHKYFSQNDEDGITLEIFNRLGITKGTALEYGVGNGLENNSLILLMAGWQVLWIGSEDLKINVPDDCKNLAFSKNWVTKENCTALASELFQRISIRQVDFLSIDLDGNDIYIFEELLQHGLRPAVILVEYNGKFPPPIRWQIKYDPEHRWDGSDYQGASLQAFLDVAERYEYILVCCNVTGANAYFIRSDFQQKFSDVPQCVQHIFFPADYNWFIGTGHYVSPKTIEVVLR